MGTEILMGLVVFAAAFTHTVAGFGFGLVSMGLLPLLVPVQFAVPLVAVYAWMVNGVVMVQMFRHIDGKRLVPFLVGALVGAPLGIAFLRGVDPRWVQLTLGVILVVYCTWSLMGAKLPAGGVARLWAWPAALLGGVLGGAFNTGGPPAVVYLTLTDWPKDVIKATLQVFFFVTTCLQLGLFFYHGMLTDEMLVLNAALFPVLLLGVFVGTKVYDRVDQALFRKLLLMLLTVVGIVFLAKSLSA